MSYSNRRFFIFVLFYTENKHHRSGNLFFLVCKPPPCFFFWEIHSYSSIDYVYLLKTFWYTDAPQVCMCFLIAYSYNLRLTFSSEIDAYSHNLFLQEAFPVPLACISLLVTHSHDPSPSSHLFRDLCKTSIFNIS